MTLMYRNLRHRVKGGEILLNLSLCHGHETCSSASGDGLCNYQARVPTALLINHWFEWRHEEYLRGRLVLGSFKISFYLQSFVWSQNCESVHEGCARKIFWPIVIICWVKRDQLDATCFIITLFNAQHVSDVNTSERFWALNKVIIKQVASSWSVFTQLSKLCTVQ